MTYLGLTLGPSLGGWLTQLLSWRVVFFINIPIGTLGLLLGLFFIQPDSHGEVKQPFDFFGSGLFILGLSSMILWMNQIAERGWTSPVILSLIFVSIISTILFIVVENHVQFPMLDLKIFRISLFTNSVLNSLLNYICLFSITFLLPFYLIQGRNLGSAQAGLLLTIQPILMAIAAPISGALSDRFGARLPGMVGMLGLSIGLFLLSRIGPETTYVYIGVSLALTGIGTGTFISPNTSALMGSAPKSHQGIASGIQAASRNIGMVFGIGLAGAIFSSNLSQNTVTGFYRGIDVGFFVSACLAILGIFISAAKKR
jgi:MFS family permease